jgi:hypothetical protein
MADVSIDPQTSGAEIMSNGIGGFLNVAMDAGKLAFDAESGNLAALPQDGQQFAQALQNAQNQDQDGDDKKHGDHKKHGHHHHHKPDQQQDAQRPNMVAEMSQMLGFGRG